MFVVFWRALFINLNHFSLMAQDLGLEVFKLFILFFSYLFVREVLKFFILFFNLCRYYFCCFSLNTGVYSPMSLAMAVAGSIFLIFTIIRIFGWVMLAFVLYIEFTTQCRFKTLFRLVLVFFKFISIVIRRIWWWVSFS